MFRSISLLRMSFVFTIVMLALTCSLLTISLLSSTSPRVIMAANEQQAADESRATSWIIPPELPSDTILLAHWLGWFGLPNHRQTVPRYNSTDPLVISRQISQARSMGIDGFIVDWYGPESGFAIPNEMDRKWIDEATAELFEQAQVYTDFHIALMYDYGAISHVKDISQTTQMILDLRYAYTRYLTLDTYFDYEEKPLLFLFPTLSVELNIELDQVVTSISLSNASLIYQSPTTKTNVYPYVDGFYSWVQADDWEADGNDWGEEYLKWFSNTMATLPAYDNMLTVGGVWAGFNDSLADWRSNTPRFISRRDGQTWLDTWKIIVEQQPPIVQIATWNDWEEGTAIEPGVSMGTWRGYPIHTMDEIANWYTMQGSTTISVGLLLQRAGHDDGAVLFPYHLALSPTITNNWVQIRHDFTPALIISPSDHIRISYMGTASNTLQIGLIAPDGKVYFSHDLTHITHLPWWSYITIDYQSILSDGVLPFSDTTGLSSIFISVKRTVTDDIGGIGSLTVDGVQTLNLAQREVPANYHTITPNITATQKALNWLVSQQQENGLLKSWQEETADNAWLYDQALGLIAFTQAGYTTEAELLAQALHELQEDSGYWYGGYHYNSYPITASDHTSPTGANAWVIYALAYYAGQQNDEDAAQDAQEGAMWLSKSRQRITGTITGSLPALPGELTAPTEPNLGAWWAFQATGLCDEANLLGSYLLNNVWDDYVGRFRSDADRYEIFLDNQTWGASFLQANGRHEDARRALSYAYETLATCSSNGLLCGFDGAGPFSVWNEGTAQYITAGGYDSQYYWEQLMRQQAWDGGLPGSPDSFRGYSAWLTQSHGIAPTAWFYFVGTGGPFHLISCLNVYTPFIVRD